MADEFDVALAEQEAARLVNDLVRGLLPTPGGRCEFAEVLLWEADAWCGPRGNIMRLAAALLQSE